MIQVLMAARMCILAAALVTASACGDAGPPPAQSGETARDFDGETRLLRTNPGDEGMNAAMDRARTTVPQLVARLQHAPPGLTYLGVKVRLGDPDGAGEHIWLYDVTYADGKIVGKLVDDGQLYPDFHANDVVRVDPQEISDWMTVEKDRACGGFTSRIMVAEMNAAERAAYFAEMDIPRLPPGDAVCDDGSAGTGS